MYLILAAALAGIAYLAYEAFAAKYFTKPVVKRNARSVQGSGEKVVVATDGKGQGGYPASAQPYEEEWIPEHLKNKGDARRRTVKKGTTSDGEGVVSGGEITSGGEGGKKTAGKSKGKGKK
jgi:translocon-associated protein subunit alpha